MGSPRRLGAGRVRAAEAVPPPFHIRRTPLRTLTPEELQHVSGSAASAAAAPTATNLFDPLVKLVAFVLIVPLTPILFPILYGRLG